MTAALEVRDDIRGFLARFFTNYALGDGEDIFAAGFVNSLFAMQLVLFIEKKFGFPVENEDLDLDNFRTIDAMVNFVTRKLGPRLPLASPGDTAASGDQEVDLADER